MDKPEKPPIIIELEKEIKILKGRLTLCEDAIEELIECYHNKRGTTPS